VCNKATPATVNVWYLDQETGRVWMDVPDLNGAIYLGSDISEDHARRRANMFLGTERARQSFLREVEQQCPSAL
jgi:hypothetical protein